MTFQSRLFFRLISKNREIYLLKIITLAIAFACSTLIILFSINEFGYDRFHHDPNSVFRVLQRNTSETYSGNRLSNRIPPDVFAALKANAADSMILSRVKVIDGLNLLTKKQRFADQKIHVADPGITRIFSFEILDGSPDEFNVNRHTALISSSAAVHFFGDIHSSGKQIKIFSMGDTLTIDVAAVYKDFPQNSHEEFNCFINFDVSVLQSLRFNANDAGVYGRRLSGIYPDYNAIVGNLPAAGLMTYKLQPLPEIYFGPRVLGEDARHGDEYSIIILVCITCLILFLALTSYINLTVLTLPHRAKELAVKKLAGTSQWNLTLAFARESFAVVGISLVAGIVMLVITSSFIEPILSINLLSLLKGGDLIMLLIMTGLFVTLGIAPIFMTLKFTRATPVRLLSTQAITFPRFKRVITFLQLGVSIFLIVASTVIRRQVNYSLLKEPGRNYDQIIYMKYPQGLTNEDLLNLHANWKRNNMNIVDVIATSQLPDRISSKEVNSEFYSMSVDPFFPEFFGLKMIEGRGFTANDGDSLIIVNEKGKEILGDHPRNVIGVIRDMSGQFNLAEKPIKMNSAPYYNYNFLCVRVLEVDIRKTVRYVSTYFSKDGQQIPVSFMNKRFEAWLTYQDRLNTLSGILTLISGLLACCAIYGLSVSLVRDKVKQMAIHKLCGARTMHITRILVKEFAKQLFIAIVIFGPLTYIFISELLRNFVYSTHFIWLDPFLPIAYCGVIITLLCGFQAMTLNRTDLSSSLKA